MFKFKKEKLKRQILGRLTILALLCCSVIVFGQNQKKPFSVQLAESVLYNNPDAWMTDFQQKPSWGYVQGLVSLSLQ